MNDEQEDDYGTYTSMKLWDKKLNRLDTEMLLYIQQRAYIIQEARLNKLNETTK